MLGFIGFVSLQQSRLWRSRGEDDGKAQVAFLCMWAMSLLETEALVSFLWYCIVFLMSIPSSSKERIAASREHFYSENGPRYASAHCVNKALEQWFVDMFSTSACLLNTLELYTRPVMVISTMRG
jgi:hypothetical protein